MATAKSLASKDPDAIIAINGDVVALQRRVAKLEPGRVDLERLTRLMTQLKAQHEEQMRVRAKEQGVTLSEPEKEEGRK